MTTQNNPAWSVRHLADAMERDMLLCHTALERQCLRAIAGREIRETAEAWARIRKLTPGEVAIAAQFGYRGAVA